MKYIIASDIHGSAYWCKKLIDAFEKEKAVKLLLLGDILYHGPRNDLPLEYDPKAVIEMLNNLKGKVVGIRGNCDSEVDSMVLNFPILANYAIIPYKSSTVFLTHGHIYNENSLPPLSDGDVIVHGHTHIPVCKKEGSLFIINPGSVSIPKENSHHGYMTFESGNFTLKDFDGNEIKSMQI